MWLFVLLIYEISLLLVFSVFLPGVCSFHLLFVFFFNTFALLCFQFSTDIPFSSLSMASI